MVILDRLGNLTSDTENSTKVISTHSTLTFTANLDSGRGADFVWKVTASRNSVSHVASTNLGVVGESLVTFVKPDIYTVTVGS